MSQDLIPKMKIRKVEPAHLSQFNDLLRYAFQVTDAELLKIGWENDDIKRSKYPILESANVIGWFEGPKLAAQIAVYPIQMNVRGYIYDVGFVTGVATYPEYTGRGLMSALMKQSLTEMRAHGQSISLLYPYSIPFYRHKGWELISDKMTFQLKDVQLPKHVSAPGRVRRIAKDSPDLAELHDRFAEKNHGCILRNGLVWEEYWRWDADDIMVAVYYGENDEPLGYMVYMLTNDVMHIKEIVCLNQEAWDGLWVYITAHDSMVDKLTGNNYSNTSIAFWLEDSDIKESLQPYMMARIVDVEKFLSHYNFSALGKSDCLTLVIKDDLLEWNNLSITLHFDAEGGIAHLSRKENADKRAGLNIGTLAALLMGYKRPGYLKTIGRLDADKKTAELLENVIPREKAYISDYM